MLRSFVIRVLLAISLFTFVAIPAWSQLIMYEGFNYTAGERVIGQTNPGTTTPWYDPMTAGTGGNPPTPGTPTQPGPHNPTTPIDPQVIIDENVAYPGLAVSTGKSLAIPRAPQSNIARMTLPLPSGQNYYGNAYGNMGDDGLFLSFSLKLTNFVPTGTTTANAAGGYIAGFHAGPLPAGTQAGMSTAASYGIQVRIRREVQSGAETGKYQLGIVKNNVRQNFSDPNASLMVVSWDETHSFGINEPVLVAASYVMNGPGTSGDSGTDDEARLWVNPIPGQAGPATAPTVTSTEGNDISLLGFFPIRSYWFRSDTLFPGDFLVDELRIGQTLADVTPAAPAIAGDYNGNGTVDAADYVLWSKGGPLLNDPLGPTITSAQYDQWRTNFGKPNAGSGSSFQAVPEPGALLGLLAMAMIACCARQNRR